MTDRTRFQFSGSFSRTHRSLVKVKLGSAGLQVRRMSASAPIFSVSSLALLFGTDIAPDQRGTHNFVRRIQHHCAMHLSGKPDTGNLIAAQAAAVPKLFALQSRRRATSLAGFCSAQPICGEAKGSCSSVAEARTWPSLVDNYGASAAGPNVDSEYMLLHPAQSRSRKIC